MIELTYEPDGAVLTAFLMSPARVNLIQGPRGSGKSTVCVYKLAMNAANQPPQSDGIRRRRAYIVRNTFDELKRTTLKTWHGIFPEDRFPGFKWTRPFEHRIRVERDGDVPGLDWEVLFLALDNEDDRRKLLSAEASDVWFNEFREIMRVMIDDAGPILRYPAKKDGGVFRPMIIADTNAPPEGHWFSIMSGQVPMPEGLSENQRKQTVKPENWRIFMQPPAMFEETDAEGEALGYRMNPAAENVKWLPERYYEDMIEGRTRSWIRVNVLNLPGQVVVGEPVWPDFREEIHCAKQPLEPYADQPILIGVDFGRSPAMVFCQRVFDRWLVLSELTEKNMGAREFAKLARRFFAEKFPGFRYQMWGDPAGSHLAEADDISPFMMFRAEGWRILPAPTNDPTVRIGAIEAMLRESSDGRPRCLLSPSVPVLKAAMLGGYHYRRKKVSGEVYMPTPEKNWASHVADAFQYVAVGAGEGRALLGGAIEGGHVVQAPLPASVFQRRSAIRAQRPAVRGFRR